MSKTKAKAQEEDMWGQAAGAIGGLVIVFAVLAAIKDKLGLSWPATLLVTAGALIGLGYGVWKARTVLVRRWAEAGTPAASQPGKAAEADEDGQVEAEAVPVHPELTAALITAGIIGKDEVIRADEARISEAANATVYDFLVPPGKTFVDVQKKLDTLAGVLGVTRMHMKLERSRDTERRVKMLKLHEPPFTQPFPAPTRREIETFAGVPFGHEVTGELGGVPSFERASLIVAGMTQMGKTTLVNGLIACLLIAYREFDLYLLDGKFCGLTRFEKIATRYESSDDPAVLESMVDELNDRADARYMKSKEAIRARMPAPTFKPVFFIVDEAADFFTHDGSREGAENARRITEKTRSLVSKALESGIASVLLTQRPSDNAIPVKVRDQFLYRLCLYVASSGTAKVALGDTYFETVAPINPALLDPNIKGQGVLYANGVSTLLRGFNFSDEFIWQIVDEVYDRRKPVEVEKAPLSPLEKAIEMMRAAGVDFMPTADLAPAFGITEKDALQQGQKLGALFGGKVKSYRPQGANRGYRLADLEAVARAEL
ncbi:FtsK/SpoIIIE domain-containing protein [Streptomyces sp. NPDC006339]|uniref:FtsK/SpoIIIE domain-containing protein n=1 Tax=Streptomyces sp. NPDC006339 TaxID=3156755 RepID=UPI0033BEA397